jgi:UbiD family decarboxylase
MTAVPISRRGSWSPRIRKPEIPDIGHYRFEIIDRQTMSFNALPNHRFGKHIARARRMGRTTYQAAVVIGVDPLLAYTAPIQVPEGTNDFEVADMPGWQDYDFPELRMSG